MSMVLIIRLCCSHRTTKIGLLIFQVKQFGSLCPLEFSNASNEGPDILDCIVPGKCVLTVELTSDSLRGRSQEAPLDFMCLSQERNRKWNPSLFKMFAWITSLSTTSGVLAVRPLYNWSAPERKPELHISLAWLYVAQTHTHTHTHAHSLHNLFIISLFKCGLSNQRKLAGMSAVTDFWVFARLV